MSRRRFLAAAGVTLSATALTCSGLAALGIRQPEIDFSEPELGDPTMTHRVLVAYASKAGSSVGVAEAIGQTLAEHGARVDVRQAKTVTNLRAYDAVVAGSAIRGASWLPEAMQFLETHRAALAGKPFAAFMVCITLAMPGAEKYRDGVAGWLAPVRALARPVSEGLFAGVLDYSKLALMDGLKMRALSAATRTPEGDYRDWDAIRAWARDLAVTLQPVRPHA
jgi:menaquinone-dependent protoporphyrinogen oxidase